MATAVTYALLLLDVLAVALFGTLVVFAVAGAVRRLRGRSTASVVRSHRTEDAERAAVEAAARVTRDAPEQQVADPPEPAGFGRPGSRKRRCNDCRSSWMGVPSPDVSPLVLRFRRAARRRARGRKRPVPAWAARQGWGRCPSCLSANVRDSRRQPVGSG